jgi:hypothetical protein
MAQPFQITIRDILLVTYIVAAVTASIAAQNMRIGLLALSFLGMYAWNEAALHALLASCHGGHWQGLLTAMLYLGMFRVQYIPELGADTAELAGWGRGC